MSSVIVVIRQDQNREEWKRLMRDAGLEFEEYAALDRIFHVSGVTIATFPLVNHPGYESIEPGDMQMRATASQPFVLDEYLQTANWSIARIVRRRAPWPTNFRADFPQDSYFRCERDGTGVDVYVVDSGIRTTHSEFGGRATNVFDATGTGPTFFHGTACASMAAGSTVGIARGASIFSFQWIVSDGSAAGNSGTVSNAVSAINQAVTHYNSRSALNRPAVVNLSFTTGSSSIASAVAAMINVGMVVVAAAGNEKTDLGTVAYYPAEDDADNIVVGGTTALDIPYYDTATGSNYGTRIDVCAPSQNAYQATNTGDNNYRVGSGTSYGTAYATGAIACMLQGHARLTSRAQVQAVRNHVINTATTGKVLSTPQQVLPDRLLYLNPDLASEVIPGL